MPRYSTCLRVVAMAAFAALGTGALGGRMPTPRRTAVAGLTSPSRHILDRAAAATLLRTYGALPLRFEANRGQTDGRVRFLAHGKGYALFLTATEAVLALTAAPAPIYPRGGATMSQQTRPGAHRTVLRFRFPGANAHAPIAGLGRLPGTSTYLSGAAPRAWHTGVPGYTRVEYRDIYPGVNLVYYGNQGRLEYDLTVAPGADPRAIRLAVEGARSLRIDAWGALVLRTRGGDLRQDKPVVYQEVGGVRRTIAARYALMGAHEVGIRVGGYDAHIPLVIDPVLGYSTYLGGGGDDEGRGIAVDGAGAAYVAGYTDSTAFPDAGGSSAAFPTTAGAYSTTVAGGTDTFVTKLNAGGTALVYSTYLGGSGDDQAYGIALDGARNAYLTGSTRSTDFPTTAGAYAGAKSGSASFTDAFIAKLNAGGGALAYATYLGGGGDDVGRGIAVDAAGAAYVAGYTKATDFPTTAGAVFTGNTGGQDAFVAKLGPGGSSLAYSLLLGGSGDDRAYGIAVDAAGSAYVAGSTRSTDFPTTAGAYHHEPRQAGRLCREARRGG